MITFTINLKKNPIFVSKQKDKKLIKTTNIYKIDSKKLSSQRVILLRKSPN